MPQKYVDSSKFIQQIVFFLKPDKWKLALFSLAILLGIITSMIRHENVLASSMIFFLPIFIFIFISPVSAIIGVIDPKLKIFGNFYGLIEANIIFSIALLFIYFYILACFIVFSFKYLRKKFDIKLIAILLFLFFVLSISFLGWLDLIISPTLETTVLLIKKVGVSLFSSYIFTLIVLSGLILLKKFLTMPLIKKLAIVLSIILVYLAIFYPAFQGNIIPKTLDIEERNLALYAIEETESQLDIQGDGILQYEVVSFKRPVEHIVVHNNFPGSNNVWQETCDVEIKMKTRTFFGQPFYEIIVYLNSTENFNYNYCDLEIPNECDFDPNCKP